MWIYVGGAAITLVVAIILAGLNVEDQNWDYTLLAIAVIAATLFWPLAWLLLAVVCAIYLVREHTRG
jgi:hypothetical protein